MKWRVWFATNDKDLPWRIQDFHQEGVDEAVHRVTSVEFERGYTEVVPERKGRQPAEAVIVCEGKLFLSGTKAVILI